MPAMQWRKRNNGRLDSRREQSMSDAGLIRHNDDTRAFQRTDNIGLDRSAPTAEPENGRQQRAF